MNCIMDTHTLLWYFSGNPQLSKNALDALENQENELFISQVTFFEMAIKVSLGKLKMPCEWEEFFYKINTMGWGILPPQNQDFISLSSLPFHHSDPFDRLIACQAINKKLTIISKDNQFDRYGASRLW